VSPPGKRRAAALITVSTVILAGIGVAGFTPSARALVRTRTSTDLGVFWDRTPVPLLVDDAPFIPDLPAVQALRALRAAANRWSQGGNSCTSFVISVVPREGHSTEAAVDGENRFVVRSDAWCNPRKVDQPCYDSSVLAVTTVTSRKSDGVIIDADIELNATAGVAWRDLLDVPVGTDLEGHDLEATLTHELGHFAGYNHTCLAPGQDARNNDEGVPVPACDVADPAAQASVLYPFEAVAQEPRRDLTVEDARDHCRAYPRFPDTVVADGSTGCTVAAAGPSPRRPTSLIAPVVILAVGTAAELHRRRSRRRDRAV
jgi:hypothetical protein